MSNYKEKDKFVIRKFINKSKHLTAFILAKASVTEWKDKDGSVSNRDYDYELKISDCYETINLSLHNDKHSVDKLNIMIDALVKLRDTIITDIQEEKEFKKKKK